MQKNFKITYLPILLLILFSINGCITYKPISIKEIKSVEPLNDDLSSGKVVLNLRVANPNNYAIKIKKYDLNGFLNNHNLGKVDAGNKIVLKKNSTEDYMLTLSPDMEKLMAILPAAIFRGSADVALRGSVKVKALFLSKTFDVDLKKRVSAKDLR